MTAHTPTPWADGIDHNGDPEFIFGGGAVIADCGFFSDVATNIENVAFVLKAVNSHDALKASLTEMVGIYWGDGDGHEPPPECIQRAMAALASIKETV